MPKTYECQICYGINSAIKLHCQFCGAIPKQYSITREVLSIEHYQFGLTWPMVAAIGCDRTERHRTVKRVLATVPADYYADCEG